MATHWLSQEPRFTSGQEALEAFLVYAGAARSRLEAKPEWREWLLQEDISGRKRSARGFGKWLQDLQELGAPEPTAALDLPELYLAPLRRLKQREMIRIGLLDFAGLATVSETIEALTELADFCLDRVLALQLARTAKRWGDPGTEFCILGMGKLGGRELNYSSDIDVIFVYGEEGETSTGRSRKEFFTRLGQQIIKDFSANTADGGLFRIDLRLRPEGDSGPLALSYSATENYYAAFGENWERMAMIKARVSAGDDSLAYELDRLRAEFCFGTSLSTDLIGEIAALKQRVNQEIVGAGAMERHVKLGRGGIREIEFLVQTQQLLYARKLPYLQNRRTLKTLEGIATCELLPREKTDKLAEAYRTLRTVEHRLQMREELQTHTLPEEAEARALVAESLDLSLERFDRVMLEVRDFVHQEFTDAFTEREPEPGHDFDTSFFLQPKAARKQLEALNPESREEARVSPRTRARFRRFEPVLEEGLHKCVTPDIALPRFVRFAEQYGAPGLFYETMASNPKALELLLTIFDRSQHYSDMLTRSPHVFEDAARAGTLDINKDTARFLSELEALTGDLYESARAYRQEELIRIFIRDALGLAPLNDLHAEYSALAEACLEYGLRHVVSGGPLAVIALGKFGGMELGYGSDLDCVLVGEDQKAAKELSRLMTEQRPSGILFPLDFRMRPDSEGPIVMPVETFRQYYQHRAQYWEFQAAVRARFAAGDETLGQEWMGMLDEIWPEKVKSADPFTELGAMRHRIETERISNKRYPEGEFKTGVGGMLDVEFGLQALLLDRLHREPSTLRGLDWLAGLSSAGATAAAQMREDYLWLRRMEAVVRSDSNDDISHIPAEPERQEHLARWLGYDSRQLFLHDYSEVRARNRLTYEHIMARQIP